MFRLSEELKAVLLGVGEHKEEQRECGACEE